MEVNSDGKMVGRSSARRDARSRRGSNGWSRRLRSRSQYVDPPDSGREFIVLQARVQEEARPLFEDLGGALVVTVRAVVAPTTQVGILRAAAHPTTRSQLQEAAERKDREHSRMHTWNRCWRPVGSP
jgi:hypothetical protein